MSKSSFLCLTAVILLLAGGSWWGATKVLKRWRQLNLQVFVLQSDMRSLHSQVSILKSHASVAETRLDMRRINDEMEDLKEKRLSARMDVLAADFDSLSGTTTTLDPSENGFGSVNTNTGRFLIACDNAEPYLDGERVRVRVGNPNAADYNGFTLKVKWGPKEPEPPDSTDESDDAWDKDYAKWKTDNAKWRAGLQGKDISFADLLKTGTWHSVEVVLTPNGCAFCESFQRRFTWPVGHFSAAASMRFYHPSRTFETPDQTDEDQANNYLRPTRVRKKQMD